MKSGCILSVVVFKFDHKITLDLAIGAEKNSRSVNGMNEKIHRVLSQPCVRTFMHLRCNRLHPLSLDGRMLRDGLGTTHHSRIVLPNARHLLFPLKIITLQVSRF